MRCYICDSLLSTPTWNSLHKAYEPCPTCMDIIHHVFETNTPEYNSLEELEWEEGLEDVVEDEGDPDGVGDSNPPQHGDIRKERLVR